MLAAIVDQLASRSIEATLVAEPVGDFSTRVSYGLKQKTRFFLRDLNFGAPFGLLPRKIRDRLGLVRPSEVDLVLDASGFVFGDAWPLAMIQQRLGMELLRFRQRGVPIVLLPQAFGPFNRPEVRVAVKAIIESATLVYARDEQSLSYLKDLTDRPDIHLAPDFTNLLEVVPDPVYTGRCCLIPNHQVLARSQGAYLGFLKECVVQLLARGEVPFWLIHEGPQDEEIATQVNMMLDAPLPIVKPSSACDIKAIIAACKLQIGSRFHGLVSALATGVPVLAVGWSHKYEALLADYGVERFLLSEPFEDFDSRLDRVLGSPESYLALRKALKDRSELHKARAREMWDQVFSSLSL